MKTLVKHLRRLLFPIYSSPRRYWSARYSKFGATLTGPGCVGLDEEGNQEDYESKWSHIMASLRNHGDPTAKSLLDAGCGVGAFTTRFVAQGYSVSAVDFAQNAVDLARRRIGEQVKWYIEPLDTFSPGRTYDVVACIDVLFHITDDKLFERTLANLATLVSRTGILVIQDHLVAERDVVHKYSPASSHVRWRSLDRYQSCLSTGWSVIAHDHYDLPIERQSKDLLVFSRT
jgi:SAM-dependent methyltransferase